MGRLATAVGLASVVCFSVAMEGAAAVGESNPATTAKTTLEAAAIANAHAWLTGTVDDIKRYQGPECASTKAPDLKPAQEAAALKKMRAPWAQYMGQPLKTIKIQGAHVRNVTATSGEAEVEYDLPPSVVGNDNWVGFKRHNGRWKVSDCRVPFSGSSQRAVPLTPTT